MSIERALARVFRPLIEFIGAGAAPTALPEQSETFWQRHGNRVAMFAIMAIAIAIRVPGLFKDLPFTYYGDEEHFIQRSLAVASGDLNPHWFHKPAFLMYVLAFFYGLYYLLGHLIGRFESTYELAAEFLQNPGTFILIGRCVVCAFGISTVYFVGRLAERILGSPRAGLAAAAMAAVQISMVTASQQVKADAPCAFLMVISVYVYFGARDSRSRFRLAMSALLGGAAIGTKYYGVILIPAFAFVEMVDAIRRRLSWSAACGRTVAIGALFFIGFFISSPYHMLDPTFGRQVGERIAKFVSAETEIEYASDSDVTYEIGVASVGGAFRHFLGQFTSARAFGFAGSVLVLFGAAVALVRRPTRLAASVPLIAIAVFVVLAITYGAYHTSSRHLVAIAPFLCLFAAPAFAGGYPRAVTAASAVLLAVVLVFGLGRNIVHDRDALRSDSRNLAYEWLLENIDPDSLVLLDDYGPQVPANRASLRRMRTRLSEFPQSESFTAHSGLVLSILERYPAERSLNVDRLGHPWWIKGELDNDKIWASWKNRDMGNPLIPRVPETIAEYRRLGYRYIVTNTEAQSRYYTSEEFGRRFPRWRAFYDALHKMDPIWEFDPRVRGGKGPVILVYALGAE